MHINEFKVAFCDFAALINSFLAILFWVLIIYGFDDILSAGLTVIAAVIHESGHLLFYFISGKSYSRLRGTANGLKISKNENLSYIQELILCVCGPGANVIACAAGMLLYFFTGSDFFGLFGGLNLITAISNLVPIEGYDGFRAAVCLMRHFDAPRGLFRLLECVSFALISLISFAALFFMYKTDGGYWMYGVFAVDLYLVVKRNLKSTFCEN